MSANITYTRNGMAGLKTTDDHSLIYWRKQARDIFDRDPSVMTIEVVRSGRKLDSAILSKGAKFAPEGKYVVVASTGGKWGKSRSDYPPVTVALAR